MKWWGAAVIVLVSSASVSAAGCLIGRAWVHAEIEKTLALTGGSIRAVRRVQVELALYDRDWREGGDGSTSVAEHEMRLRARMGNLHSYVRSPEEGAIVTELEKELEKYLALEIEKATSRARPSDESKQVDLGEVYRRLEALTEINVRAARVAQREAAFWRHALFWIGAGGFFFTGAPGIAWIWLCSDRGAAPKEAGTGESP